MDVIKTLKQQNKIRLMICFLILGIGIGWVSNEYFDYKEIEKANNKPLMTLKKGFLLNVVGNLTNHHIK